MQFYITLGYKTKRFKFYLLRVQSSGIEWVLNARGNSENCTPFFIAIIFHISFAFYATFFYAPKNLTGVQSTLVLRPYATDSVHV